MIKKAIIPVAGMGTRFLPATKANPKEMLTIVDKPVIQYIVEEAVESGIEEIIFVTGREKRSIEDHFDASSELNSQLERKGKFDILKRIKKLENIAKIAYVRQSSPLGDGHAILCAKHCISENEDFAVLFGDDIIDNKVPSLAQLISTYEKTNTSVIGVKEIYGSDIESYGVIEYDKKNNDGILVKGLVEKPLFSKAPSNLGIIGKYICTYDIFDSIEKGSFSKDGELRLIDGFIHLLKSKKICAKILEGTRYDTGSKIGWIKANIAYALKRKDLRDELLEYIKGLA